MNNLLRIVNLMHSVIFEQHKVEYIDRLNPMLWAKDYWLGKDN